MEYAVLMSLWVLSAQRLVYVKLFITQFILLSFSSLILESKTGH